MKYQVDNAIIMAAGTSSRFAPLSYEMPKGLITVRGEILVERQIQQLREAGIEEIILVTGYKKECYEYLKDKFGIILIHNPFYETRNNNSSIYVARKYLHNSYICSSDNYFQINPFEKEVEGSYYAAVYADGETVEWCMNEDEQGYITDVSIGGKDAWYMLGHAFWDQEFSKKFVEILEREYEILETKDKLWEKIYMEHLKEFKMKVRHYSEDAIFEFDTLDELRVFDTSYIHDAHSVIMKKISEKLACDESEIVNICAIKTEGNQAVGCSFEVHDRSYEYDYASMTMTQK